MELEPEWVQVSVVVQAPEQVVRAPETVMEEMVASERVAERAQGSELALATAGGLETVALSHSPKLGKMRGRLHQLHSRNRHC
jgi:hypothetical protein